MRDPAIDDPEATARTRVMRLCAHLCELDAVARELAEDFAHDGPHPDELVWHWLRNAGEELGTLAGRIAVATFHEASELFVKVSHLSARIAERDELEREREPEPESDTAWSEP